MDLHQSQWISMDRFDMTKDTDQLYAPRNTVIIFWFRKIFGNS
jgi:hypothetical protein